MDGHAAEEKSAAAPEPASGAELERMRSLIEADLPGYLRDLAHLVNNRLRELHESRGRRGRALDGCLPARPAWCECRGGSERRARRHGGRDAAGHGRRPDCAPDRTHGHRLRSGYGSAASVPHRGERSLRPGSHGHEERPSGRSLCAEGVAGMRPDRHPARAQRRGCPSGGSCSSPTRTRRSGRPPAHR